MKVDNEQMGRLQQARERLRRTWLMWGVAPLVVIALMTLAVSAAEATPEQRPERRVERTFEAVLAVSAMLFLVGFSLDGRWTDAKKLALRLRAAAGGNGFKPTKQQLAAHADLAFRSIYNSTTVLTATGVGIAVTALLTSLAGLGATYAMILIVLAAEYQIFVLSRHPYYLELMEMALRGELAVDDENNQKRK